MPPPREASAENQSPAQIASGIETFIAENPDCAVLEDGKVLFDLATAKHAVNTEHGRCTLQFWSEKQNIVRRIVSVSDRNGTLRLTTSRFGQVQTKLLELTSDRQRKAPATRASARERYLKILERVLLRSFPEWKPEGFRTAVDLERSFGPAYARGVVTKGNQAWAVVGVNDQESAVTVDGILTIGILWLDACRERANGRKVFQGLRLILPRGMATLTLSRLAWMNSDSAQWELWELDQASEDLHERDAADQGNLRTRLVHHPDEAAAKERFAKAVAEVLALVPLGEEQRVDQHLHSTSELGFLLHGLEFGRARMGLSPGSFAQTLEITIGAGGAETVLTPATSEVLREKIAELFARRRPLDPGRFMRKQVPIDRRIGAPSTSPAHARLTARSRLRGENPGADPLYRAAPERWLESVLRRDLAPLTRSLAPQTLLASARVQSNFANEHDPDTIGNRADPPVAEARADETRSRVIPRLDPQHVYAQVPAIAGASDRGLLDLLGVTTDGRLAVIELKADEDLHLALQGLDYWVRVRHHHMQPQDTATGLGEFQRLGYFRGVELSPLPPRLYLVAPALHIHPATETVLRYFSPRVEWNLLALDERWRQQIRVVWRRQSRSAS
jgi:hypothetical protein